MTRYIGKQPAFGNFVKLDAISAVNGQAAYTMQNGGSNFTNYDNVNQFIVSLNGVIQAPTDSFTVSGSTITFASNLVTGDVINFILVLGDVLSIGTPSDNTISTAKLQDNAVQTAKIQDDAVTKAKVNFISDATAGVEVKGDGGSNDGYIALNCRSNSHAIKLKSPPHSAGQSYTLTFPSTAPATDKFLKTDNSGNLSFADAGGGKVLQVLSMSNVGEQTISSSTNTFNDSALTLAITPSATTSKILIMYSMTNSQMTSSGYVHSTIKQAISGGSDVNLGGTYGFAANGTDNGSSHIGNHGVQYLDSPSTTNAITYTIQTRSSGSSQTYRRLRDSTTGTLTLIEIGA